LTALFAENTAMPEEQNDALETVELELEIDAIAEPDVTFASLGVPAPLVAVLEAQGIIAPFPVQAATLPDALSGRDILGRAQTGSGKTLGFSLPLVTRLAGGQTASRRPRGLILVPTRELVTQVHTVLRPLARAMGLWVTTIYGGVSYGPQITALHRKTDIVVATPGRLADLIGQGECDLSDVEVTVIDEADQMADLGFLPIVRRLLETTPGEGQRMLFSATLDAAIDVLARRFLNNPVLHSVDENSTPAEIEHHVITIDHGNRLESLAALVGGEKRSLVFTRTKHGAERLARQLTEAGIPAAELHGNLRQGARARNLAAFSSGVARVMVATDIAARGIHIDGIDLVVHSDPPAEHKAYAHRSGRTARGGADGIVVTLQTRNQVRDVRQLMRQAGISPHEAVAMSPDSEVLRAIAGEPAPRVTVNGKVSELVRPEDRITDGGRPGGRPGGRSSRDGGRPRRDGDRGRGRRDDRSFDRKPREDRAPYVRSVTSDRGPATDGAAPAVGGERREPARFERDNRFNRDDRPARSDRPYQGNADRPQRFNRDDRPAGDRGYQGDRQAPRGDWQDRPQRFNRDDRPVTSDRPARPYQGNGQPQRGDWYPRDNAQPRSSSWRPASGERQESGHNARPATGGRPAGAPGRAGYSAARSVGKRRDQGQGRHF
jgi:superfamily II DNA/RNA helicase